MRACDRCGSPFMLHRYMNAFLCPSCAPTVPTPDPARTMAALAKLHQSRMRALVKSGRR